MWWLLAAVILLAVIAAILIAVLSGGSHHAKHAAAAAKAPAAAAAAPASASATAAPTSHSSTTPAASTGAAALSSGEVGGGGVTAQTATGRPAPAGSIGAVLFATDKIALDVNARHVITNAVKEIRTHHSKSVTVVGYTDSVGSATANHTLSLERARAVEADLRGQLRSSTIHFSAVARGQTHPVASNSTAPGEQLNPRVAILVKQ